MDLDHLLAHITPAVYATLKQVVETGRWPDGSRLDDEQRGLCLQAVIAWGERHLPAAERVGHIPARPHAHCGGAGEVSAAAPQPLKWRH
jgi:uncharacterized protein YeaC (DUF1315 family)